jgi:hypothetical protein
VVAASSMARKALRPDQIQMGREARLNQHDLTHPLLKQMTAPASDDRRRGVRSKVFQIGPLPNTMYEHVGCAVRVLKLVAQCLGLDAVNCRDVQEEIAVVRSPRGLPR